MAKLQVLEYPDRRLRTKAQAVGVFDGALKTLIADMFETMYAAPGIGLAATQVDVHRRLLVMDVSDNQDDPRVFINPVIRACDGEEVSQEGCLSVPNIYADVTRAARVSVDAVDADGAPFSLDADGLLAVCIQHEMDHLIGKLFVDYLSPLKREMVRRKLDKQRRQAQPAAASA